MENLWSYLCESGRKDSSHFGLIVFSIQKSWGSLRLVRKLGWDRCQFVKARETWGYPASDQCIYHANSCSHDQIKDPNAQPYHFVLDYAPTSCDYYKSFDSDINSCPY